MNLLVRRSALVKREAYSRLRTNTQNLRFCVLLRHQHFFNPRNHASHLTASHFSCVHWLCGSLYSGQCTQRAYFKAECMIVWGFFFIISLLIGGNILFTYWCWTLDFFSQRIVVRCVFMCMWGKWVSLHASQLISPMTLLSYSAFFCLHQYVCELSSSYLWLIESLHPSQPLGCVSVFVCVWAVGDPSLGWRTWWPPCSMPPRNKGFSCGC